MSVKNISEIDANFIFGDITREDLVWYDRYQDGFVFDGCHDIEKFHRIPRDVLATMPIGVRGTCPSAGIRLRFRSDTSCVAIKAVDIYADDNARMSRAGSSGFDLYISENGEIPRFVHAYMPACGRMEVSGEYILPHDGKMREFELNFPPYDGVKEFWLGLSEGAQILPPHPFIYEKQVVFYGSSITQGGCTSRPGNAYTTMLARQLGCAMTNLGFSGNAKGEPIMAEYIASMPMAAFIMDYDHNAPTPADLKQTHEPFFKIIREAQPELPVLFLSRPNSDLDPADADERFAIVEETYRHAVEQGDKNVWLIDGRTLFGTEQRDACTVDGVHPSDIGFYRMYSVIRPVLEEMLKKA